MEILIDLLLFAVLVISFLTDLKQRKIYNKVLFPALILALLLHPIFSGFDGIKSSILGLLLGFGILLIPYLMGGMGAGDVKLLAVIGAIKGPAFVFATAVYMALLGGLIGIALIVLRKDFFKRLYYAFSNMRYGMQLLKPDKETMQRTFPYGVAIVGGACLTFFLEGVVI
ncbi:A24 family peptidase [Tenuibacillus multivorans]|uniref:Prepilin peptidase CpaA n=1 Tax=Tenuibacillus multivorans TaxID=237069 RepID=A0A1G9WNU9_9BACI|nr:prepilin peptidase [Tenuibacillus multivorans]GEL77987.1 type 4 prepilin peptidase 1 [Tenuibacillus multivorans]SDM86242.1 prepilin peptidase CpaA [Tenuibacillus multivorans]